MRESKARALVKDRAGLLCERCGYVEGSEWHHRKNRSQGGQWSAANGLWLCSPCHRWVTEHPAEAIDHGWACPSWVEPASCRVLLGRHGWVLLDELGNYVPLFGDPWAEGA